jgi:hypothetical protein
MSSRFDELLTDQQLENASTEQIDDSWTASTRCSKVGGSQESCAVSPRVYPSRPIPQIPQIRTRPRLSTESARCARLPSNGRAGDQQG